MIILIGKTSFSQSAIFTQLLLKEENMDLLDGACLMNSTTQICKLLYASCKSISITLQIWHQHKIRFRLLVQLCSSTWFVKCCMVVESLMIWIVSSLQLSDKNISEIKFWILTNLCSSVVIQKIRMLSNTRCLQIQHSRFLNIMNILPPFLEQILRRFSVSISMPI